VAAPITDLPFTAAVSVSGPSSRVTREQARLIAPVVIAAAADLRDGFLSGT
jgi:IclR family transcriptional regulator, acetate operon repressor